MFEKDEGHGPILKIIGYVLIVVIVMGPGFSSLGGKICIKKQIFRKGQTP